MSAGSIKHLILKSVMGSLSLCFISASYSVATQGEGMPPKLSTNPDSQTPMTDIHDIKPALAFDAHWPWWVWLLIIFTVAALVALAWWLKHRLNQKGDTAVAAPVLSPEEEAFQHLDALAAEGNGDPKRFYFSLSAVLRCYVERRFDFPAAEMTTEELLPRIRQLPMEDTMAKAFKHFCQGSDPIKFADAAADQTRMQQDMAFARRFVEQTTLAATTVEDDVSGAPPANASDTTLPTQLPHQKPSIPEVRADASSNTKD